MVAGRVEDKGNVFEVVAIFAELFDEFLPILCPASVSVSVSALGDSVSVLGDVAVVFGQSHHESEYYKYAYWDDAEV